MEKRNHPLLMPKIKAALTRSIENYNLEKTKEILEDPSYLDDPDFLGPLLDKAILLACKNEDMLLIDYLLSSEKFIHKVNINVKNGKGIEIACENGHIDLLRFLLDSPRHKGLINRKSYEVTGFNNACTNGHTDIVRYLMELDSSGEIELSQETLNMGFQAASGNGHLETVRYLMENTNARIHPDCFANEEAALKNSCKGDHIDVVKYLFQYRNKAKDAPALSDMKILDILHTACSSENKDLVAWIFCQDGMRDRVMSPEICHEVFHEVCARGNFGVAVFLIDEFPSIGVDLINEALFLPFFEHHRDILKQTVMERDLKLDLTGIVRNIGNTEKKPAKQQRI